MPSTKAIFCKGINKFIKENQMKRVYQEYDSIIVRLVVGIGEVRAS